MGTALSVFVLLSVSVAVIRVASVALRLTGLTENTTRFQALSAFTGTGFDRLRMTLLAVRSPDGRMSIEPSSSPDLEAGDMLILFGQDDDHDRFARDPVGNEQSEV